jgi:hypothetical protein
MVVDPLQKRKILKESFHAECTFFDESLKARRIRSTPMVCYKRADPLVEVKAFIPSETPEIDTIEKTETQTNEKPEHPILCASCGTVVSYREHILRYTGISEHVFTNPHGFVFRVGLLREAPGVFSVGDWTEEFSWFTGFAWRFAVCGGCMTHLGWEYLGEPGGKAGGAGKPARGSAGSPAGEPACGTDFSRFYGLVVTKLTGWD